MDGIIALTLIEALFILLALPISKAIIFISNLLGGNQSNVAVDESSKEDVILTQTVSPPVSEYNVFLSFRGEDTRYTFSSFLYQALDNEGIQTFMDHKLRKGDNISPVLLKTIEESNISLIIFSKDYASSTWCMDELVHIMKCKDQYKRIVIPIFYDVDPTHVRKQNGRFGDGFAKLKKNFVHDHRRVQEWIDSLIQSANLSGFHSKNFRSGPELIKEIVKDISSKLSNKSFFHEEGLVEIDHQIQKIEELLSRAPIVGIWGMGGIGKTTLAEAVFNRLKAKFQAVSFVDVREELLGKIGFNGLLEKCLKELLKGENIDNLRATFVKERLQRKKILLVLDDVDNFIAIKDLMKACHWFGEGSRIIITSRDKQVLENTSASTPYQVQKLEFFHALRLFSLNAFKQNEPFKSYLELSKWAVEYCEGNPLALIVLGCFLAGKKTEEWESALEKLNQDLPQDILEVLKFSFDGLDDAQKNVFLDLAFIMKEGMRITLEENPLALIELGCFLAGKKTEEWESALEKLNQDLPQDILEVLKVSFHELDDAQKNVFLDLAFVMKEGMRITLEDCRCMYDHSAPIDISVLKDRSLISVDEYDHIKMHALLMEMGLKISRQQFISNPDKPIRLRRHQDIYHLFNNDKGIEATRCLSLDQSKMKMMTLNVSHLQKMYNLIFLKVYNSDRRKLSTLNICGDLDYLPEELRFFIWEEYPMSYVPLHLCAKNLVMLEMPNSNIRQFGNENQHFPNIKTIDLSGSKHLTTLSDLSHAPKIESVYVNGCANLDQIHSSTSLGNLWFVMLHRGGPKRINIGGSMEGARSGLVIGLKYLDVEKLSIHEVRMKVLVCGDMICGFRFKHVVMPLEETAELRKGTKSLTSLLPFVRRVDCFKSPIEFGPDFIQHYTYFILFDYYRRGDMDSSRLIMVVKGPLKRQMIINDDDEEEEDDDDDDDRGWAIESSDLTMVVEGPLRRQMINDEEEGRNDEEEGRCSSKSISLTVDDEEEEEEEELIIKEYCRGSNSNATLFTTLPKSITYWSLLTELRLKESEMNGKEGCRIPQLSILNSLMEESSHHHHSTTTIPFDFKLSVPDIPPSSPSCSYSYTCGDNIFTVRYTTFEQMDKNHYNPCTFLSWRRSEQKNLNAPVMMVEGPLRRQVIDDDDDDDDEEEEEEEGRCSRKCISLMVDDEEEEEEEEELIIKEYCRGSNNNATLFTTLPKSITYWSLLTELRLKESEMNGKEGCRIPQLSILNSLMEESSHHHHSTNTIPFDFKLSFPDIPPSLSSCSYWYTSDDHMFAIRCSST